jgi:hypothetical protein
MSSAHASTVDRLRYLAQRAGLIGKPHGDHSLRAGFATAVWGALRIVHLAARLLARLHARRCLEPPRNCLCKLARSHSGTTFAAPLAGSTHPAGCLILFENGGHCAPPSRATSDPMRASTLPRSTRAFPAVPSASTLKPMWRPREVGEETASSASASDGAVGAEPPTLGASPACPSILVRRAREARPHAPIFGPPARDIPTR